MKASEWQKAKKKLTKIYFNKGITKCERCGGVWGLSFHHLDKRSSGRAENTFKGTRLLCIPCHDTCEHDQDENEKLREMR